MIRVVSKPKASVSRLDSFHKAVMAKSKGKREMDNFLVEDDEGDEGDVKTEDDEEDADQSSSGPVVGAKSKVPAKKKAKTAAKSSKQKSGKQAKVGSHYWKFGQLLTGAMCCCVRDGSSVQNLSRMRRWKQKSKQKQQKALLLQRGRSLVNASGQPPKWIAPKFLQLQLRKAQPRSRASLPSISKTRPNPPRRCRGMRAVNHMPM